MIMTFIFLIFAHHPFFQLEPHLLFPFTRKLTAFQDLKISLKSLQIEPPQISNYFYHYHLKNQLVIEIYMVFFFNFRGELNFIPHYGRVSREKITKHFGFFFEINGKLILL